MHKQQLFLGFFGTGITPKPDIAASILSIVIALPLLHIFGMETLFMLTFVLSIISTFEINKYIVKHSDSDYKEITIDDALGMWMSLMIALSTAVTLTIPYAETVGIILAFTFFTLFQQWKPSTIGWIAKELKGGLGIILGSLLSGIAGGMLSVVVLMGITTLL
jgi:phosphatidylglycerophosphatase A